MLTKLVATPAVLALSSAAFATSIPVSSPYGSSPAVCALYTSGKNIADEEPPTDTGVIVSPSETIGWEEHCLPKSVIGNDVVLTCTGTGDEWTDKISLSFDASGDTLYFRDENGTITLHRCR